MRFPDKIVEICVLMKCLFVAVIIVLRLVFIPHTLAFQGAAVLLPVSSFDERLTASLAERNIGFTAVVIQGVGIHRPENVKNSTVKPTERFREEGVGREPFSKGVSSDRLKCSSCRNGLGKILSALSHGRKSSVGRVDPFQVVVMDVSVNHALYLIRRHFCRIHRHCHCRRGINAFHSGKLCPGGKSLRQRKPEVAGETEL